MLRTISYLIMGGVVAYAAPAVCPCPTVHHTRTVHTLHIFRRHCAPATQAAATAQNAATAPNVATPPNVATQPNVATANVEQVAPRFFWLPAGLPITTRLDQPLTTRRDPVGTTFTATVSQPVISHHGEIAVPRGAVVQGHLVQSKRSGRFRGRARMALALDSLQMQGNTYQLLATGPSFASRRQGRRTAAWYGGSVGSGVVIGAIAGGGVGAAAGLGAGAVVGTAGTLINGRRNVRLAPETPMIFTLSQGVKVHAVPLRASY